MCSPFFYANKINVCASSKKKVSPLRLWAGNQLYGAKDPQVG
jgi:hypothetical protein